MLNRLHAAVYRPDRGWDPVPRAHQAAYAVHAATSFDKEVVPKLEASLGSFEGKRVLDLGGGPGDYSIEFCRHGAQVVWHDVSRRYMDMARANAKAAAVEIEFSLGYLDDAGKLLSGGFDLVFCRVCWFYCMDDLRFAQVFYSLVKPGGAGYIECNTPEFADPRGFRKLQYLLDSRLWFKLGHPYPPHGRIESLFRQFPIKNIEVDYSSVYCDRVLFFKNDAQAENKH